MKTFFPPSLPPSTARCYTGFSKASSGFLRLPQASSGFCRLPQASTGFLRLPQASSGFLRLSQASSGFLRLPQASSGFLRPQASSGVLMLPQASPGLLSCIFPKMSSFFFSLKERKKQGKHHSANPSGLAVLENRQCCLTSLCLLSIWFLCLLSILRACRRNRKHRFTQFNLRVSAFHAVVRLFSFQKFHPQRRLVHHLDNGHFAMKLTLIHT